MAFADGIHRRRGPRVERSTIARIYWMQFSGTMKDADVNDIDYYEELELVGFSGSV